MGWTEWQVICHNHHHHTVEFACSEVCSAVIFLCVMHFCAYCHCLLLLLLFSFLNPDVAYACGGSGSLFKSLDGGKSWKRDRATDNVAGNLYSIKFFQGNGFILGNDGILLRYIGGTQPGTA